MYWWEHAARLTREGRARRFGLITTNSLRQTFNRHVVARHLAAQPSLTLAFAVPDHPWVDSANGAAVRIAMTVGALHAPTGELLTVIDERPQGNGEVAVRFERREGEVHADLTIGAKVALAQRLAANAGLCFQGMNLVGKGFRLDEEDVRALGYDVRALPDVIKPHCNARDMMQAGEHCYVIDLFGFDAEEARRQHPALYQWLFDRVKPERDHNNRASRKRNWWLFGEPVGKLRVAWRGLRRVILTPETSKHRVFAFQDLPFCPDHKLYAICVTDALVLGVLSSAAHARWALRAGGRLGVGNDPTWTNTTTFLPFPFPSDDTGLTPTLAQRIRSLAEQIDAHRKARQAAHAGLTLTGIYNVVEKLKSGEPLTPKERTIHEQGLVGVLKTLHDELDAAMLDAYGCSDLALPRDEDELLVRLVALNAKRAAEEAHGLVRWLRPEFEDPARRGAAAPTQAAIDLPVPEDEAPTTASAVAAKAARQPWPAELPDQVRAVAEQLASSAVPLDEAALAARFTGRGPWKKRLPQILRTLEALGRARTEGSAWRAAA